LIGISFLFAAASWTGLVFQPVRKMHRLMSTGWNSIWKSLETPNGKRIAISWVTFTFATGITTGVYLPFMLERAGMTMVAVSVYGWVALALSTILAPFWGRFSDRFGYRNTLIIAWGGVFWLPMLYLWLTDATPRFAGLMPWPVFLDAILGGIFWPTFALSQTNLVIAEAPSEKRAGLFAMLSALTGLTGFIAALIGGWIAQNIGERNVIHMFGIALDDLRTPMFIGAILRFLTGLLIFTIHEPPRQRKQVTTNEAFNAIWRMLIGKPYRPGG
jgi:MFS family permease